MKKTTDNTNNAKKADYYYDNGASDDSADKNDNDCETKMIMTRTKIWWMTSLAWMTWITCIN